MEETRGTVIKPFTRAEWDAWLKEMEKPRPIVKKPMEFPMYGESAILYWYKKFGRKGFFQAFKNTTIMTNAKGAKFIKALEELDTTWSTKIINNTIHLRKLK